jgi:transposase
MFPIPFSDPDVAAMKDFIASSPVAKECTRAQTLLWLSEGCSVDRIAHLLGVSQRTVYNWARRFQERAGLPLQARLADAARSGRPPVALGIIDPLIDDVIEENPRDFGYHYTGWTADLLRQHLHDVHGIIVSRKSVSRAIDRLGIRWKRPRHHLAGRPETWRQAKGG